MNSPQLHPRLFIPLKKGKYKNYLTNKINLKIQKNLEKNYSKSF